MKNPQKMTKKQLEEIEKEVNKMWAKREKKSEKPAGYLFGAPIYTSKWVKPYTSFTSDDSWKDGEKKLKETWETTLTC